jgi:hypothetical protein
LPTRKNVGTETGIVRIAIDIEHKSTTIWLWIG